MIIITDKTGQLCNRLWAYSPFVDYAIQNNIKLIIIYFEYDKYFENLNKFDNIKFIKKGKLLFYFLFYLVKKAPNKILKIFKLQQLDSKVDINLINKKNKIILVEAWLQKKPKITDLKIIKEIFKPKQIYTSRVEELIENERSNCDILVGVHMRRGDYKYWGDGKYYYNDSVYNHFLKQFENLTNNKKRVSFLLCSDEKIELKNYNSFSVFQIPKANLIEDLYGLSLCDYIMGPTSTYSRWASFYGQKPLLILNKPTIKIEMNEFSIMESLYKFKNGKVIPRGY